MATATAVWATVMWIMWIASTYAAKDPVNVVSAMSDWQKEQAENMLTGLFNVTVSYLKTLLDLFVWFFTRSDVLWVLVIVTVALFIFGVLRRKFMRKSF